MQEDEPMEFVTYKNFEKKMIQVLRDHEYEADTDDVLLRAFKVGELLCVCLVGRWGCWCVRRATPWTTRLPVPLDPS